MTIKNSNVNSSFVVNSFSGSISSGDLFVEKTITPAVSAKTITFNNHFGLSYFGSSYNAVLRISDGSTTVDFSSEDAGGSNSSDLTKIGVGSDRAASDVLTELIGKINFTDLDVTISNASANSTFATMKITAGSGKTITITEDPAGINSGNFGGSEGFTTIVDSGTPATTVSYAQAPFRFASGGAFNIRKQPVDNHYKTFVGDRRT